MIAHRLVAIRRRILREWYKVDFVNQLRSQSKVLDVGCGNNSPKLFKTWRPDIYYVGIDVGDYNQDATSASFADEYIVTTASDFCFKIEGLAGQFDAVVSSHNLEHCLDPKGTLDAMLQALKIGGRRYLSFPCEQSVNFPSRRGTLNFYDDPSHRTVPDYREIIRTIEKHGFRIDFQSARYRPLYQFMWGLIYEPLSRIANRNMRGTWALYGFESIIWATKNSRSRNVFV